MKLINGINNNVQLEVIDFETVDTSGGDQTLSRATGGKLIARATGSILVHLVGRPDNTNYTIVVKDKHLHDPMPYVIDKIIDDAGNIADANLEIVYG